MKRTEQSDEELVVLEKAAPWLYGRGGKRPHLETVRRWCRKGCKLRDGSMVRLRAVRLSGTYLTCKKWVREFDDRRFLAGLL